MIRFTNQSTKQPLKRYSSYPIQQQPTQQPTHQDPTPTPDEIPIKLTKSKSQPKPRGRPKKQITVSNISNEPIDIVPNQSD